MRSVRLFVCALLAVAAPANGQARVLGGTAPSCADSLARGKVDGRVLSRAASAPIAGARVVGRWGADAGLDSTEVLSDARGRFTLCGLPFDARVYVRADDGTGESDASMVTVARATPVTPVTIVIDVIEEDSSKAEARSAADEPLKVVGARTISLDRYNAASGRGTLVGVVVVKETGQPLPYADLLIEPFKVATFTSESGTFRLVQTPAGAITVRARRIGYVAATARIELRPGATDTVRLALPAIALRLDRVRVSDAVCPDRGAGHVDSAIVTILSQMQLNAERARLMAQQYPFEMLLERTIANEGRDPHLQVRRIIIDTVQVDTVSATMEHGWRYAPGQLVRPGAETGNRRLGAPSRMVVPQLVDFAEPAFLAAHCFRYAGIQAVDGQRMLQVDFQPAKGRVERASEVNGSLYFDTLTFQIQRARLNLERNSPQKAGDIWVIRVDTWFRDVVPTLPVIQRIAQRTTLRTNERPDAWPDQASTEVQRLIDVRFLHRPPQ